MSADLKVLPGNQIHLILQVPKHILQFIKCVYEDWKSFQQHCLCHKTVQYSLLQNFSIIKYVTKIN
jgi:hypothetical protein